MSEIEAVGGPLGGQGGGAASPTLPPPRASPASAAPPSPPARQDGPARPPRGSGWNEMNISGQLEDALKEALQNQHLTKADGHQVYTTEGVSVSGPDATLTERRGYSGPGEDGGLDLEDITVKVDISVRGSRIRRAKVEPKKKQEGQGEQRPEYKEVREDFEDYGYFTIQNLNPDEIGSEEIRVVIDTAQTEALQNCLMLAKHQTARLILSFWSHFRERLNSRMGRRRTLLTGDSGKIIDEYERHSGRVQLIVNWMRRNMDSAIRAILTPKSTPAAQGVVSGLIAAATTSMFGAPLGMTAAAGGIMGGISGARELQTNWEYYTSFAEAFSTSDPELITQFAWNFTEEKAPEVARMEDEDLLAWLEVRDTQEKLILYYCGELEHEEDPPPPQQPRGQQSPQGGDQWGSQLGSNLMDMCCFRARPQNTNPKPPKS